MLFPNPMSNLRKTKWRIKNGGPDFAILFDFFEILFTYIFSRFLVLNLAMFFFLNKMADPIWRPHFSKV